MAAPVEASGSSSTTFSLLGRNLKLDTAADAAPHLAALQPDTTTHIELGGNTLGQDACEAFARALPTSSIVAFDAADIFTGRLISEIPRSLAALSDALAAAPALEEVNFSDNAFGGRCADAMTKLFATNQSLRTIRLQNNGLGISGGKIVAAALAQRAASLSSSDSKSDSTLNALYIGRNRLENGSAPDIAAALSQHGASVEVVAMPQNGIRMAGIQAICESLGAHCPNLRVLDVQDNTLVFRGSRALARAIPSWTQLHTLNLSDTLLRSKGGSLVFDALAKVPDSKLEVLQLQYCELNRTALADLARALETGLPALKVLELHGNWAEEEDECIEKIKAEMERRGALDGLKGLDELEPEAEEEEDDEEEDEEEDGDEEEDQDAADQHQDDKKSAKADTSIDALADALSAKVGL
ncbi:Ran GAP Rna1 [Tilletia horrida]|nr:Ran GAP Rna1 [Tilletia horrida]